MRHLCLVVLVLGSAVFAQTTSKSKPPVQNVDFGQGEDVRGGRASPFNDVVLVREKTVFKNLIQVRASFTNELNRSVDALR